MADKIQLEVVTPERRVLAEPVDMVTVPGLGGELGILPGHTSLVSELQTGVLTYVQDGKSFPLHVPTLRRELASPRHVQLLQTKVDNGFYEKHTPSPDTMAQLNAAHDWLLEVLS